jgi:hypothetical protein
LFNFLKQFKNVFSGGGSICSHVPNWISPYKIVSWENDIFYVVCKIDKNVKIGVAREFFCLFYTRHKKYWFFVKLHTYTYSVEKHAKFLFIFLIFYKYFFSGGSICSYALNGISASHPLKVGYNLQHYQSALAKPECTLVAQCLNQQHVL